MSKQRSTPKYTSNQHRASTSPHPRHDITDIRYFVEGYVLHHKSRRHSPHTIVFYTDRLGRLIWFLEHENYPTTLPDITSHHLRHFLVYIAEQRESRWDSRQHMANRPLSQASIHSYAKAMRAFFIWATREARLAENPFDNVEMPSLPNQWRVQTFTDEEIAALFNAIDRMGTPFVIQRNRAILSILLDSGVRAGELLSLCVDDVDLQEGVFTIIGKGKKERSVVIGSFARRELWSYLAHFRLKENTEEPNLFLARNGTPLTYDGLKLMFQRLKELTGITRVGVHAHICRHTFATKAHRNGMRGVVLQEALGHSAFDTTRRYYLDVSTEDLKQEHRRYGPLDNMREMLHEQRGKQPRSVEIPSADVLAREVKASNYCAVARKYGVTDTAIRKRLKKAGLI
jgi:site-specific recombinase XerD